MPQNYNTVLKIKKIKTTKRDKKRPDATKNGVNSCFCFFWW